MTKGTTGWRISAATDKVVFLVGFGEWDSRTVQAFRDEYQGLIATFGGAPWAILEDATDWNLHDDVVQEIMRDHNRWIVENGCRFGCAYTGPSAINRLLLYRLTEPDRRDYRFRVFSRRSQAVDALIAKGFPVTENQIDRFFRGGGPRN